MTLTHRTIKAGSWQLVAVVAKGVLQLLVLAVLARYVLPREFGYIAMANMVMIFVDMFADAGIGPAIIQKEELTEKHIRAGFFLSIILGTFFVLILWLCAPLIATFFKAESLISIIRWIAVSALITKIGIVSRSRIEREMRFDILMWIDVGSYVFGYALVGILMAMHGSGAWAIVVGKLTQCCLQTACLLFIRPGSLRPFIIGSEYKELLTYGGGLTLTRVFDSIASQGDYFIIGHFLGSTSLGFYDRASSIMSMPGQHLNLVLDKALFPAMSQVQSQAGRLEKAYFTSTSIVSTALIPLTVLMFLIAPEIIYTLLGPNWSASIWPFRILLLTIVCRIFITISDTLVRATGAVYASAVRKAITALVIISFSWVGTFFGLKGVAIAVDIANVIGYILMIQLSKSIVRFRLKDYFKLYTHGIIIGSLLLLTILPIVTTVRQLTSSNMMFLCVVLGSSVISVLLIVSFVPSLLGESLVGIINNTLTSLGIRVRIQLFRPVLVCESQTNLAGE
ncbi:MAG: lipopolysaccharide biosynthesis protein [Pseudomonadota bacterium]